ncbi:hypothetical protein TNCV_3511321 [Trichonephila clavipes]|nr:hypothetical protein TNCV_3511321 [Trichonephila clavipes]
MTPKWSPKSPNWPPKMMPTWLYRQDFAKFSLNRHYSKKKGLKNLKEITENVERKERAVKIFPLKFSIPGIGNKTVNSIVLERSSRFRYRLRPDCGDQWHTGEVREEIKRDKENIKAMHYAVGMTPP